MSLARAVHAATRSGAVWLTTRAVGLAACVAAVVT